MNSAGVIFFTLSWAALIVLNLYCFGKILRSNGKKPPN